MTTARPIVKTRASSTQFSVVPELRGDSKAELEASAFARRVTATVRGERAEVEIPSAALQPTRTREVSGPFGRMLADPGPGAPIPPSVRERVAEVTDQSLDGIRIHQGEDAASAAAEAGVSAFAFGDDIFLADGIAADDLGILAHEIAHVLQQRNGSEPPVLAPGGLFDWLLDEVADFLRGFAAYRALTTVLGRDPLTGKETGLTPDQRIAELVRMAGFPAAAAVLEELAIIATVGDAIDRRIRAHRLTVDRVFEDIKDAATSPSSAGRIASDLLDDALAAIRQAGAEIIQHVRTVLAPYIEKAIARNDRGAALWRLATGVLHYDPLRGQDVERSTEQMLVDFFTFVGKPQVIDQMRERGTLAKTVEWLDAKLAAFAAIKARVIGLVGKVLDALSLEGLGSLPTTVTDLVTEALGILEDIAVFAATLVLEALKMFKDSLLALASEYARKVPGFDVVRVMLGYDPFTRAPVKSGTLELLQELVKLFASDATYAALNESGQLGEAAANIDEAIAELGISPQLVLDTIAGVWDLITWESILSPIETFAKILARFGDPLARIATFLLIVVREIVGVIVVGMGFPKGIIPRIIENVQAAAADIKRDPVGFLLNLVQALVQGFQKFADNIGDHLLAGLTSWLLRGVRQLGIKIPEEITLQSAITLVLEVLGLSLDMLWTKIGERIGPERAQMLRSLPEKVAEVFAFIQGVEEGGIGFLWEQLAERLENLWDTLFDKAMAWITDTIVKIAVTKVVAMLAVPALGAAMGAINTVIAAMQTLVEYLADIAIMIDRIVGTIAEIARGDVEPSATGVEKALAAALPFAIGFLANFLGLGDLPEKIKEVIESLREMVDAAVDWLLDKAIELAKSVLASLTGEGDQPAVPAGGDPAAVPVAGAVNELVDVPGDQHHIVSDGPDGALRLHSGDPVLLSDIAALREAAADFLKKEGIVKKKGADPKLDEDVKKSMAKLVAAIRLMGEAGVLFEPGKPGVGIGTKAAHGAQQITHAPNTGVTHIVSTQSEHIVPFAVGQSLWTSMLGEEPAARPTLKSRDAPQTTIVIYLDAAKLKTYGATDKIVLSEKQKKRFVKAMMAAGESDTKAIADAKAAVAPDIKVAREEFENEARDRMNEAMAPAVDRTVLAVKLEHELVEERGGQVARKPNGKRRGEQHPAPDKDKIKEAAKSQVETIVALFMASFEEKH